jgi:hypothetical protein
VKKKLLASALLACSLVTLGAVSAARAELPPAGITILETVDSVSASNNSLALRVEGVVQGEAQARVFDVRFGGAASGQTVEDRCLKFLLIAQSHPGRYQVEIVTDSSFVLSSCKLKSR